MTVPDVNWLKRKILRFTTKIPVRNSVEISCSFSWPCLVATCHHVTARPLVADGGTAYNMEGSCE